MRINQNIMAFNAFRNLTGTNQMLGSSLEKLSSGFRINRAADDAAGLVVSEGLRAQVSGLRVATRNAQDGVSVVQTAEGALQEVHSMLRRMRDLSLQASNTGANDAAARAAAQAEVNQLVAEVDRISSDTKFGQVALLDGGYGVTNAVLTGTSTGATVDFGAGAAGDATFDITVGGAAAVGVTLDDALTYNTATAGDAAALAADLTSAIRGALYTAGQNEAADAIQVTVELNAAGDRFVTSITATNGSSLLVNNYSVDGAAGTSLNGLGIATGATDSSSGSGGVFQVGANSGETIAVRINEMSADALGLATGAVLTDFSNVLLDLETDAAGAVDILDDAIASVSEQRGLLGAIQNRFENTIANLSVTAENLAASESRIRDTDMAHELVNFTRHQILQQAGTAMLAQANQVTSSVLSLLR